MYQLNEIRPTNTITFQTNMYNNQKMLEYKSDKLKIMQLRIQMYGLWQLFINKCHLYSNSGDIGEL